MSGIDLGGQTLVAGVYRYTSSALLTGTLTLNAQGNANAVFIFQIGSTLTAASGSRVTVNQRRLALQRVLAGRQLRDLNTTAAFAGNILALTSAQLRTARRWSVGCWCANGGAVLDSNDIFAPARRRAPPSPSPPGRCPAARWHGLQPVLLRQRRHGPLYSFAVTAGSPPRGPGARRRDAVGHAYGRGHLQLHRHRL